MTSDPLEPTAPVQGGPSPTGGGPRRNPDYVYRCEVCGDPVEVDYNALMEAERKTNHRPIRWGAVVRCEVHVRPPHRNPPKQPDRHPLEGTTAKRVQPDRHLPPIGNTFYLNPNERMEFGVTVTIRDSEGNLDTWTRSGAVGAAIAYMAGRIDQLNEADPSPGWRIVTISTPGSIYGDLQGQRDAYGMTPERIHLSRLGRLDLLAK